MGLSQTQTPKVVVEKRSESYSLRDGQIQMPLLLSRQNSENQRSWIEKTFMKRECCKFIPSSRDASRCCCGKPKCWLGHPPQAENVPEERWHPYRHTESKPTDAYGVLEFQGAPHPSKAQYVRLSSYDTKVDDVLQLLQYHWGIELPKLLITVHGGILNFDLQPKLKRVFRKGLLKAAKTTGAWIITGGTNTGVTRHVGDAISDRSLKAKSKLVAIGIAPWGVIEHKDDLVGKDITVPYHCVSSARNNYSILNNNHSYFLLMDNGTVGKYGGEIIFRKRLEKYLAHQKTINSGVQGRGVPVICVVLEGGANTIRSVLEYVTDTPPVPVVVCDGSGRAADLLAFAHKFCLDDGSIPESLRDQLILTIEKTFQYTQEQAEKIFIELMLCVKKKELITVFRMGEGAQDIDLAILTALLKGTNASAPDQLSLALTWDRVDIARSHIFVYGQEWPEGSLEQAMMDALINDRVDFVKLLLENGVHMQSFLSIARLEELYNTKHGPRNTLNYLVRDIRKHLSSGYQYTLLDIGLVIEHLMGGAFRSSYCRKGFRHKYTALKRMATTSNNLSQLVTMVPILVNTKPAEDLFPYPFHDLMVWAVLMKRQKMALFMWQHGEEAMAKALMACKLYRSMAHEADADDLEIEIPDEIRKYAEEFQTLALELLEHCYKIDDDYTQQLLTYELKNFSDQTCLSLAVAANHREFVAHKCSQMLLNDMWMGGLRMRKNTSLKVLLGILIPPYILFLEFKSKEELQLMPQTMEEHLDELDSQYTDSDKMSVSSFEDDQNAYVDEMDSSFTASNLPTTNKENGVVMGDFSIFSSQFTKKKKSPLRLGKKIYEFYNAPITKFWANSLFYCVFLGMYIYIVLGQTLEKPRWQEYYVMGYIATLAVEKIRQIIASEPVHLQGKLKVYFDSVWNIWDTVSIMFFASAVIVRHFHSRAGRVLYAINIVFWILRTLEIFSVNKVLGPYVKIIVKLLREMCYFLVILLVVVVSFGVVRESIQIQDQETSWFSIRNVLLYPYFMLYGELFSEQIDSCTDPERLKMFEEGKIDSVCTYGSWVSPLLMFPYLLMSIVLMVNLLIARFNACFLRFNIHTMKIWKFQRYNLIVNYELHPILPPPLIILNHVFLALKFLKRRCQGKRDHFDSGLKLFLSHDDMEKLHDFEEECAEDYFREKELQLQSSSEKRIQLTAERVENMNLRIDDMNQKENSISLSIQTLDYKMTILEELAIKNIDVLNQLKYTLTQFGLTRSRHVSASSTHSNRIRHDSDDSTDQLEMSQADDILVSPKTDSVMLMKKRQDYSLNKDIDKTLTKDTAMKSPVSVHSGKPGYDESTPPLTDFPKSLSKAAAVLTRKRPDQIPSAKKRISLPKLMETSESDSFSGMDLRRSLPKMKKKGLEFESPNNDKMFEKENSYTLIERRHLNIPKLQIRRRQFSGSGHSSPLSSDSNLNVDDNVNSNSDFVYSPTDTDADTTVSIHQQQPKNIDVSDIDVENHDDTQPSSLTPSKLSPINVHIPANDLTTFYPNTADYQKMCTLSMLTPILTAHSAEYTTITDQIDTSCMINRSPPRSPTLSVLPFASESRWEDDENPASRSEKLTLKHAEEIEHKRMEMVIRHRLRQISLDESSSISDIAKLVVIEMEDKDKHSDHDEDKDYPTEDLNDTLEVNSDEGDERPITFEAALPVTIRIRRASTRDEDSQQQQTLST